MHIGIEAGYEVDLLCQDCRLGCGAGNDLGGEGVEEEHFHSSSFLRGYYALDVRLGCLYCVQFDFA